MVKDSQNSQNNLLKGYNMMLYFAGTMIMYEPSEECIVDFWKEGLLKQLPVNSSNPVFHQAASQLRESCSDSSSDTGSMSLDYYFLFSRSDMPTAPLFESSYQEKASSASLSGIPEVSEFYDSYGWKSGYRTDMKEDHLGVELLFLTKLIEKYIELDDDPCRAEMRNEIRRFIEQHLLTWVPEWHERVQEYSKTLSYKGISSLILSSVEDIYSLLSPARNQNFNMSASKN